MATQILMPALSPTMEEGTLAKWLVKEGDTVKSGDILAEIETDKATMEFEAVDEGTVGKIMVDEGTQGVKVNTPIAVLLEEGESADAAEAVAAKAPEAAKDAPPKSDAAAPAQQSAASKVGTRRRGPGSRQGRARLCLTPRSPNRRRTRHRPGRHHRQRTQRPHRQGRCRTRATRRRETSGRCQGRTRRRPVGAGRRRAAGHGL